MYSKVMFYELATILMHLIF